MFINYTLAPRGWATTGVSFICNLRPVTGSVTNVGFPRWRHNRPPTCIGFSFPSAISSGDLTLHGQWSLASSRPTTKPSWSWVPPPTRTDKSSSHDCKEDRSIGSPAIRVNPTVEPQVRRPVTGPPTYQGTRQSEANESLPPSSRSYCLAQNRGAPLRKPQKLVED